MILTIKEIAETANVSISTVYRRAKELGRLPRVEEIKKKKVGAPFKYKK